MDEDVRPPSKSIAYQDVGSRVMLTQALAKGGLGCLKAGHEHDESPNLREKVADWTRKSTINGVANY